MAKYKYKQYKAQKQKNPNTRYLILALVVIIVGTVLLIKSRGTHTPVLGDNNEATPGGEILNINNNSETVTKVPSGTNESPTPSKTQNSSQSKKNITIQPPPAEPLPLELTTTEIGADTLTLIKKALVDADNGNTIAARDTFNTVLTMELTPEYRKSIKARLTELSKTWLFGKKVLTGDTMTEYYRVHPGEVLSTIGRKFNVPHGILLTINNLKSPRLLQAGQTIKVIKGPFHVKIYRSTFTMDLYLGNKMFIKSYRIGLGSKDKETPAGRWRVKSGGKMIEPTWFDEINQRTFHAGDKDYPLGSRWIAIEGLDDHIKDRTGFAIHGTKDPTSIEKRMSRGCIRLYNGDVIELYNLLYESKSEVRIVD